MNLITGLSVFVKGAQHMPAMAMKMRFLGKSIMLVLGIFWVVMLINCLQRKFKVNTDKIAWIIVLVFLPILGAFIYLFWLHFSLRKKS
jgi:hypothetical protein